MFKNKLLFIRFDLVLVMKEFYEISIFNSNDVGNGMKARKGI